MSRKYKIKTEANVNVVINILPLNITLMKNQSKYIYI